MLTCGAIQLLNIFKVQQKRAITMKQFNLNTPKNLPKPSPVFTIQQVYSPFMSPCELPVDLGHLSQRRHEDDELDNFSLGKRGHEQEQHEQEPPVEQPTYANNDSDQQPEEHRQTKPSGHDSKVRKLVEILVSNVDKSEQRLNEQRHRFIAADDNDLKEVYDILLKKFKRLKKTKQEMTKYCMRKAFKFLSEKIKRQNPSLNKEADVGLKHYFLGFENDDNFTIPFKKNSHEKTMNTNFLKKVFSSHLFLVDYMEFLKSFRRLVEEDNTKKIKYLAETIESYIAQHTIKKLEAIKRLPWTQNILEKTQDLAEKLAHHSPFPADSLKREHLTEAEHPPRNFFAMTPNLRSVSPPRLSEELPHKKVKLQHRLQ